MTDASSTVDRVREPLDNADVNDLLARRTEDGWQLVALEWQRAKDASTKTPGTLQSHEVPYGLQVAHDFLHLEENPLEVEAMVIVLDAMIDHCSLSAIAEALNNRGLRARQGDRFTQQHIFDLMPRIVEAAPDIFGTDNWRQLRRERKRRRLEAV